MELKKATSYFRSYPFFMNIYQTTVRFNENDFYEPIVIACLCWDLIKLLMHDIKLSDQ